MNNRNYIDVDKLIREKQDFNTEKETLERSIKDALSEVIIDKYKNSAWGHKHIIKDSYVEGKAKAVLNTDLYLDRLYEHGEPLCWNNNDRILQILEKDVEFHNNLFHQILSIYDMEANIDKISNKREIVVNITRKDSPSGNLEFTTLIAIVSFIIHWRKND